MRKITVVVADDCTLLRHLLVNQLNREEDFLVAGEAENGRDAVAQVVRHRPDILLLDLDMPVLSGWETINEVRRLSYTPAILLLTEHRNLAHGIGSNVPVLSKDCELVSLLGILRSLARRDRIRSEELDTRAELRDRIQRLSQRSGLTDREQLVFEKVIFTAATSREIAAEITRDTSYAISETAVKHTLTRIMRKLQVEPRTRAALTKLMFD